MGQAWGRPAGMRPREVRVEPRAGSSLPAPSTHHRLPSASPVCSSDLGCSTHRPSLAGQHSLPCPLCQSMCPCTFRPQLGCHLPQEESPDCTSTADLSECPEHTELALVTPLP